MEHGFMRTPYLLYEIFVSTFQAAHKSRNSTKAIKLGPVCWRGKRNGMLTKDELSQEACFIRKEKSHIAGWGAL